MFKQDTVFVDIETTGGNANRDRITEVAIISVNDGELISEWSTLINPLAYIPEHIQHLTGINDDMVRDQPSFHEVYKEIYERLSGKVLVAHNARFDYGFLKNEFKRCSITFRSPVLCTVKLSRHLFPEHKRHNLDSIMRRHDLRCSARHRAMGDARVLLDFMRYLYEAFDKEDVDAVIRKQLKRPSLPSCIREEDIDALPESPGVYLFYDKRGTPLYVGKSINIRSRVLSHFSDDYRSAKEMKISQNLASIDYKQTAGELGALLKESRLIKELLPIYNRRLRRYDDLFVIEWDVNNVDSVPKVVQANACESSTATNNFGLFKTKKKAIDKLREIAKENSLCAKHLGLEKGNGPCFGYQLHICKGVCVGKEPVIKHQIRLMQALQPMKNKVWPFNGRIGICEESFNKKWTDIHIFENWCYLGTAHNKDQLNQLNIFDDQKMMFDLDSYKILIRYLKEHPNIKILNI